MQCVHTYVRSVCPALSHEAKTLWSCKPAHAQGKQPGFSEYSQFQSWGRVGAIQAWTVCSVCSVCSVEALRSAGCCERLEKPARGGSRGRARDSNGDEQRTLRTCDSRPVPVTRG